MPYVKTRDGTDLYVKDWGSGRPVILLHGWPLNAEFVGRSGARASPKPAIA